MYQVVNLSIPRVRSLCPSCRRCRRPPRPRRRPTALPRQNHTPQPRNHR